MVDTLTLRGRRAQNVLSCNAVCTPRLFVLYPPDRVPNLNIISG